MPRAGKANPKDVAASAPMRATRVEISVIVVIAGLLALIAVWLWPGDPINAPREGSIVMVRVGSPIEPGPRPAARVAPGPSSAAVSSGVVLETLYLFEPAEQSMAVVRLASGEGMTVNVGTVMPNGAKVEAISSYGVDIVRNGERSRLVETAEARQARRSRPPDTLPPRMPNDL